MIILECTQGSAEWLAARAGAITASMFSAARSRTGGLTEQQQKYVGAKVGGASDTMAMEIAGYKTMPRAQGITDALEGKPVGDFSDTAKSYAYRVAIERISGQPLDEGFETYAMRRGHELEPDCRMAHSRELGFFVDLCGFITTDDSKFGCSADCLIDDDGGGEYKCFISPEKLRDIILLKDFSAVMDQVQGCMWITGRKWWDFCLYCPALKAVGKDFIRHRVERDDEYIFQLETDLVAFERLVTQYENTLRN